MTSLKPILIAMACALLLVTTEQATRQTRLDNAAHFETRVLRAMVPDADISTLQGNTWLATQNGAPIATIQAVETDEGYNGKMAFLVAYSNTGEVLNVRTTYHRETPGLGDIVDQGTSRWLEGFRGRSSDNTRWSLKPMGDIDGVTGATITARATTRAIARALENGAEAKKSAAVETTP